MRKARKMTQKQVSGNTGWSVSWVSGRERSTWCRWMSISEVDMFAELYKVPRKQLFEILLIHGHDPEKAAKMTEEMLDEGNYFEL